MITKTVSQWINTQRDFDTYNYGLQGEHVYHYLYPGPEGFEVHTHCRVTGRSQIVSFDTRSEVVGYLRSFEQF